MATFHFQVRDADHQPYNLEAHKGHPMLIYNVASECGYSESGYGTATALYNKYKDRGFTVLAFPCNQFGGQEPGPEEEIKEFAHSHFHAGFPIMEKIDVNGEHQHPLYHYLNNACKDEKGRADIQWNFTSFLVDKDGKAVHRFPPGVKTEEVEAQLIPLLAATSAT